MRSSALLGFLAKFFIKKPQARKKCTAPREVRSARQEQAARSIAFGRPFAVDRLGRREWRSRPKGTVRVGRRVAQPGRFSVGSGGARGKCVAIPLVLRARIRNSERETIEVEAAASRRPCAGGGWLRHRLFRARGACAALSDGCGAFVRPAPRAPASQRGASFNFASAARRIDAPRQRCPRPALDEPRLKMLNVRERRPPAPARPIRRTI